MLVFECALCFLSSHLYCCYFHCRTYSYYFIFTSFLWLYVNYFQEFNKKSNSLYTILRSSRLAGSQRAPFLRRFLLRLNFNSYFEVNPLLDGTSNISSTIKHSQMQFFFYMNRQRQEVFLMLLDHNHHHLFLFSSNRTILPEEASKLLSRSYLASCHVSTVSLLVHSEGK